MIEVELSTHVQTIADGGDWSADLIGPGCCCAIAKHFVSRTDTYNRTKAYTEMPACNRTNISTRRQWQAVEESKATRPGSALQSLFQQKLTRATARAHFRTYPHSTSSCRQGPVARAEKDLQLQGQSLIVLRQSDFQTCETSRKKVKAVESSLVHE